MASETIWFEVVVVALLGVPQGAPQKASQCQSSVMQQWSQELVGLNKVMLGHCEQIKTTLDQALLWEHTKCISPKLGPAEGFLGALWCPRDCSCTAVISGCNCILAQVRSMLRRLKCPSQRCAFLLSKVIGFCLKCPREKCDSTLMQPLSVFSPIK